MSTPTCPRCRLCHKGPHEIRGYLHRVNPKGEIPAVWECRPSCTPPIMTPDERLLAAIEGPTTQPPTTP